MQQQHHRQQQTRPDADAKKLWKADCYASMCVRVGGGKCLPLCGSSISSGTADDGTHINKCPWLSEDPAAAAAKAGAAAAL